MIPYQHKLPFKNRCVANFYSCLVMFHPSIWCLTVHYYYYYYLLIRVFHNSVHWSLSDSKSPQVSRTLLNILAVFNIAVLWMVSYRPPTSKSSSPFSNPLITVPNTPITIGIIVTFMFHSFFSSFERSMQLSFFSRPFSFILWSAGTTKSTIFLVDYY